MPAYALQHLPNGRTNNKPKKRIWLCRHPVTTENYQAQQDLQKYSAHPISKPILDAIDIDKVHGFFSGVLPLYLMELLGGNLPCNLANSVLNVMITWCFSFLVQERTIPSNIFGQNQRSPQIAHAPVMEDVGDKSWPTARITQGGVTT